MLSVGVEASDSDVEGAGVEASNSDSSVVSNSSLAVVGTWDEA